MSKIAAIMINHLHGSMIRKALESFMVVVGDLQAELFVINNVPDPNTKSWIISDYPNVHLIENDHPKGFASNINQIIRNNQDFDYYLLINPDVICLPGMLSNLVTAMENNPQIGAGGPKLMNMDGSLQPSCRRFASFWALVLRALHVDRLFNKLPIVDHYLMKDSSFKQITEVNWITGAVIILRKKALDQVGLLDERFYMYFEDEDLCCRMWQNDWKVCYIPAAQAYHAHLAEGRNKVFSQANFHQIISAIKMLIKYHGNITRCYDKQ